MTSSGADPTRNPIGGVPSRSNPKTKSQSAMEYLMTYGWAILIIAVILGVLFSLGVFNPINYAPKVPAGSCHVFRPNGPGTSFNVNLVGTCSGFLPQYVAQFNGQSSLINVTASSSLQFGGTFTVTAWVYMNAHQTNNYPYIVSRVPDVPGAWELLVHNSKIFVDTYIVGSEPAINTVPISSQSWHFVAGTLDSTGRLTSYVDGTSASVTGASLLANSLNVYIGSYLGGGAYDFNGSIANVQIYNAALDANEIAYLYHEGIGGAPVYLSHLAAWWPLNGDTKDYSGNGNDGRPKNINFNGSWSSGYTQP